jgi:hypothetical protein
MNFQSNLLKVLKLVVEIYGYVFFQQQIEKQVNLNNRFHHVTYTHHSFASCIEAGIILSSVL